MSRWRVYKKFLIRRLKATIFSKFGPSDVKTCLLLAPERRLIRLRSVAVSYLVKIGFLDSKIGKLTYKPEYRRTQNIRVYDLKVLMLH
jgi:hypothetical protein